MKTYYWNKIPGTFVNKLTGTVVVGATFTGNQNEWNEVLIETMLDLSKALGKDDAVVEVPPALEQFVVTTVLCKKVVDKHTKQAVPGVYNLVGMGGNFDVLLATVVPADEVHILDYETDELIGIVKILG